MLLKGKTVLLTGGASGIGRASVLLLADAGARILLCDRNEAGAKETMAMAAKGAIEFIPLELTDAANGCVRSQPAALTSTSILPPARASPC